MNRTTIMLPEILKAKAIRVAKRRGISLGELIRESLAQICANHFHRQRDALFEDSHVYSRKAPKDLSSHHDDYLY